MCLRRVRVPVAEQRRFGYERFEYLYLEDTMLGNERAIKVHENIIELFKER